MRSPKTCLGCGGRKWRISDHGFDRIHCSHCNGSGCARFEAVTLDFPKTLPPARLLTGTCIAGEIECPR
jgi:hypothetical protein